MLKKISRLRKNNLITTSRLRRIAEWTQINPTDPETIQNLTDAMTYGYPVQIDYEGSGWRNIQPYGWNTSKDGNVLLMCYKDTGEVRSYRMDKVNDIFIDTDTTGPVMNNNPTMNEDGDLDSLVQNLNNDTTNITFNVEDNYPDDMPPIPGNESEDSSVERGIYDEELQMLENNNVIPMTDENVVPNEMNGVDNMENNEEIDNTTEEINHNIENEDLEGENEDDENQI